MCHPYVTCSAIPPYNTTRKWRCADHWDGVSQHRCSVCRKIHKGKAPPLFCLRCHRTCHREKKCSKINLTVADPTCLCNEHTEDQIVDIPPEADEHTEEQIVDIPPEAAPQIPSCYHCKKEFTRRDRPIECQHCDKLVHTKPDCSGLRRGSTVWDCGNHNQPAAAPPPPEPPPEEGETPLETQAEADPKVHPDTQVASTAPVSETLTTSPKDHPPSTCEVCNFPLKKNEKAIP